MEQVEGFALEEEIQNAVATGTEFPNPILKMLGVEFTDKGAAHFQELKGTDKLPVLDLVIPTGRGMQLFKKDESWCFTSLV